MSLKQKIYHASAWILVGYALSQGLRVASGFIISRLLSPEVFGLMAIVYLVIVAISLMTDLGLTLSVTKSQYAEKPEFINTVWSIQVLKGFAIFGMTLLASLLLYLANKNHLLPNDTAYSNVLLPMLVGVLSINAVISAFDPTWTLLATKNMQQALITKIELISQFLCASVSIAWAWLDKSPWAIVIGMLVGTLSRSILMHSYNSQPKNKWHIDKKYLSETLHFGKWILITTLISFYATSGDRIILGSYINEKTLGLYAIAYMFYSLVYIVHEKLLASVIFPGLSQSYELGIEKLKSNYHKFRFFSDVGLMFLAGFLFATANTLIDVIYDDRYNQSGYILQVLSIGFVALRYRVSEQYFLVINKPHISTLTSLLKALTLFFATTFSFKYYGFDGAVLAIMISSFAGLPIALFYKYKYQILNVKNEFLTLPFLMVGWLVGVVVVKISNSILTIM